MGKKLKVYLGRPDSRVHAALHGLLTSFLFADTIEVSESPRPPDVDVYIVERKADELRRHLPTKLVIAFSDTGLEQVIEFCDRLAQGNELDALAG